MYDLICDVICCCVCSSTYRPDLINTMQYISLHLLFANKNGSKHKSNKGKKQSMCK